MLDEFLQLSMLFDFYGALLTKKQQECMKLHLYQDLSLSEIAALMKISRQAAYDTIHRGAIILTKYENKLHMIEKNNAIKYSAEKILTDVEALKYDLRKNKVNDIEVMIRALLQSLD